MSGTNKKNWKDKLMPFLTPKLYKFTICSKRPNPSIINTEPKMKSSVIESTLYLLKRRETVRLLSIKNGLGKSSMNSNLQPPTIS